MICTCKFSEIKHPCSCGWSKKSEKKEESMKYKTFQDFDQNDNAACIKATNEIMIKLDEIFPGTSTRALDLTMNTLVCAFTHLVNTYVAKDNRKLMLQVIWKALEKNVK